MRTTSRSETAGQLLVLLQRAIALAGGDKGTLQRFDASAKVLRIVAQAGFTAEFLEHFKEVRPFDSSACGRACGTGSPVIVTDVRLDAAFAPHLAIAEGAGIRAVMSVPVRNDRGELLGVVSVHCGRPKADWSPDALRPVMGSLASLLVLL